MKSTNYTAEIKNRILSLGPGSVVTPSDFKDIANGEVAKKVLLRLEKSQEIRRLMRGVYEYPRHSKLLKESVAPDPNKVAKALARNYGWSIIPSGNTALNMLGLSTQVPATWTYVSDGPYKKYAFENITLVFKHITNKEISNLDPTSALVIQAFKALGNRDTDQAVEILRKNLSAEQKNKMLAESQYATGWIYEEIKKINMGVEGDAGNCTSK